MHQQTSSSLVQALHRRLSGSAAGALEAAEALSRHRGLRLFLVGGPVRDLLMGAESVDLDLAVEGESASLAAELAESLDARAVVHARFGTASVSKRDLHLDIASTRRETYAHPGALPRVEPAPLVEDLARRDFTVNAMALELVPGSGELVDPFRGEQDLKAGLLRVLHEHSFQDDATRMLRAVRYAGRFGFKLQRDSEALLRRGLQFLSTISGPRLRRELSLLFNEPHCVDGVALAQRYGILEAIHRALRYEERLAGPWRKALAGARQAPADELGFCLLVRPSDEGTVASLSDWLHLAGRIERALGDFVRLRQTSDNLSTERPDATTQILEGLALAAIWAYSLAGSGVAARACGLFLTDWRHVRTHLRGDDLLAMGVKPGIAVGDVLRQLRNARLRSGGLNREEEAELVRRWLRERDAGNDLRA